MSRHNSFYTQHASKFYLVPEVSKFQMHTDNQNIIVTSFSIYSWVADRFLRRQMKRKPGTLTTPSTVHFEHCSTQHKRLLLY